MHAHRYAHIYREIDTVFPKNKYENLFFIKNS